MNDSKFNIEFTIDSPVNLTEAELGAMVQGVATFIDDHINELDDDNVLDDFMIYCHKNNYPIEVAGQISGQILKVMFGDIIDTMDESSYTIEKLQIH